MATCWVWIESFKIHTYFVKKNLSTHIHLGSDKTKESNWSGQIYPFGLDQVELSPLLRIDKYKFLKNREETDRMKDRKKKSIIKPKKKP